MLALIAAGILLAAASYMAFGPTNSHVAPVLWCASWGMMLLLYRVLGAKYDYDRYIVLFTFGCTLVWLAGHFVAEFADKYWSPVKNSSGSLVRVFTIKHLVIFLIVCNVLGMGAPAAFMSSSGISLSKIVNVQALFDTMQSTHAMMAEQRLEQDSINKITLMFALAGVIMGGIYIGLGRPWMEGKRVSIWLCLAPMLPYVLMMMLTSLRSLMIIPLLALFASWIAGMALQQRDRSLFEPKRVITIFSILSVVAVLFVAMQSIRAQDYQFQRVGDTLLKLRLWIAGYQPALTYWMQHEWDGTMKGGSATFRVFAGFLGVENTKIVYGTGAVPVGDGDAGNAMTALKFFVEDWGIVGALVFCFAWGLVSGALSCMTRRGVIALSALFAINLATIIFAPNSWFLGYGARLLSPFVVTPFLIIFAKMTMQEVVRRRPMQSAVPGRLRRSQSTTREG